MDKVLIVDDDRILCELIRKRLQKYNDRFEIMLANDGEEAVEVLNQKSVSLLITDIQMPKMDGMVLLSYINSKHPHIPCIVMTSYPNRELEARNSNDNLLRFFSKPLQFDEFEEAILRGLEQDMPEGSLKGISVSSFLQMIQMEASTCLIEVQSSAKEKAFFYFREGVPHNATYGNLKGEEAAYEIIAMRKAQITFINPPQEKVPKTIKTETMGLILEAFRRKDETSGLS